MTCVVLALLLIVGGCGGGDPSFAKAAEAVCPNASERMDPLGFEPPILTGAQAASRAGDDAAFRQAAESALDELEEGRSAAARLDLEARTRLGRSAPA